LQIRGIGAGVTGDLQHVGEPPIACTRFHKGCVLTKACE